MKNEIKFHLRSGAVIHTVIESEVKLTTDAFNIDPNLGKEFIGFHAEESQEVAIRVSDISAITIEWSGD